MKKLSLGFLVLMSLILASCGGDNKSGNGGRGSYFDPYKSGQLQSVVGYMHFSQQNASTFVTTMSNNGSNYQGGHQNGYQQQVQFQIANPWALNEAFIRKFGQNGVAQNQQYTVTIRGYFQLMGSSGQVQVQSATIH